MDNQEIRRDFLIAFVRELIRNSAPKNMPLQEIEEVIEIEDFKPAETEKPKLNAIELPNLPQMPQVPHLPELPNLNMQQIDLIGPIEDKVRYILRDPAVLGFECAGPGKYLLVNRAGRIQTAPIVLTKEEIDSFMNHISTETRIPIIPGVFKGVLGNMLITAVISEYVGTRFIIQKRTPFM